MKELKVTLYDVFGYFVPGSVTLAALGIFYWSLFGDRTVLIISNPPATFWIAAAVAAYLSGHVVQAISNLVPWIFPGRESVALKAMSKSHYLPAVAVDAAKRKLGSILSSSEQSMDTETVLSICSRGARFCDAFEADELYGYREGFYRGLSVAFFLLATSIVVRTLISTVEISVVNVVHSVQLSEIVFLVCLFVFSSALAARRYRRFAAYRVQHALYALVLGYPRGK